MWPTPSPTFCALCVCVCTAMDGSLLSHDGEFILPGPPVLSPAASQLPPFAHAHPPPGSALGSVVQALHTTSAPTNFLGLFHCSLCLARPTNQLRQEPVRLLVPRELRSGRWTAVSVSERDVLPLNRWHPKIHYGVPTAVDHVFCPHPCSSWHATRRSSAVRSCARRLFRFGVPQPRR